MKPTDCTALKTRAPQYCASIVAGSWAISRAMKSERGRRPPGGGAMHSKAYGQEYVREGGKHCIPVFYPSTICVLSLTMRIISGEVDIPRACTLIVQQRRKRNIKLRAVC